MADVCKCCTKFVFMLTCNVEVTHYPVMAILQPLRHVVNHVVAFVEVITRECISHRHMSLHQLFKQHLHIILGGGEPNACAGIASSASSASATFARAGPGAGAVRSRERKQITMQNLVIKFPLRRIEHTYLLTPSPSEFNILFILEEFPSHALDCGVASSCARTNEVGECSSVISNR